MLRIESALINYRQSGPYYGTAKDPYYSKGPQIIWAIHLGEL